MNDIVIVTHNMLAGGAERVISTLSKYFVDNNINCTIIKLEKGNVFYTLPDKVRVITVEAKSKNKYVKKISKLIKTRKLIKNLCPDIVLSLPEEIGVYIIPTMIGFKIPVVVSERNNPRVMPRNYITRIARTIFYHLAAGIIFQTREAMEYFPRTIQKMGIVLPNPIDLDKIPSPWSGKRRKEIIGAGRLEKQKNFHLLIDAFKLFHKRYPDYKLIIYGEGSLREDLIIYASDRIPKDAFSFPGRRNDLLDCINGASMFVLSSDYEGMPNVLSESMAMGMPCISTNCPSGGPAELIIDGENGILVPVGDTDALYNAMIKICESEQYAQKISQNALRIRNKLDAKVIGKQWFQYLESLVNRYQ